MSNPKKIKIENDCGQLYAYFDSEDDTSYKYFYETYWHPDSLGDYPKGYKDGWDAAMDKVRKLTNDLKQ